ncbi:MAG: hypothetical protein ACOX4W_01610 [Bacilli bacterium]
MILNTSIIDNSLDQLPVNLRPYSVSYVRNYGNRVPSGKNVIVLPDIKIPIFVDKEVYLTDNGMEKFIITVSKGTNVSYKTFSKKLLGTFKNGTGSSPHLTLLQLKDYYYFIGKGIITDENFNPLVLVTFDNVSDKYDGDRRSNILKMECVDVYYSRVIFSEDFIKNQIPMFNNITKKIMPYFMGYAIKQHIKNDLNIWGRTIVDSSRSIDSYNDIILENLDEFKTEFIRGL